MTHGILDVEPLLCPTFPHFDPLTTDIMLRLPTIRPSSFPPGSLLGSRFRLSDVRRAPDRADVRTEDGGWAFDEHRRGVCRMFELAVCDSMLVMQSVPLISVCVTGDEFPEKVLALDPADEDVYTPVRSAKFTCSRRKDVCLDLTAADACYVRG
jgi:hypothetical protein